MVQDVVVEGAQNVKPQTLKRMVHASPGKLYRRADLDGDIEKILELGSFSRATIEAVPLPGTSLPPSFHGVAVSTNAVWLVLRVVEKPLIKTIRFEGEKELGRTELSDLLSLKEKDPLDEFKLKEDTDKILAKYQEKGFIAASVEARTDKVPGENQVELTWVIQEGLQAKVDEVRIVGAKAFLPKKLWKQMSNRPKKPYVAKDLPKDLEKIQEFYTSRGYSDYRLVNSTVSFQPGGPKAKESRAVIELTLEEGRLYKFGRTSFSGNTIFTQKELRDAVGYRAGKVFDDAKFKETIQAIQEMYADKGRLRARLEPVKTYDPANGETDVAFSIEEGPVIYVDHIDVEGAKATKPYVFKREIVQKSGEPFSAAKIRKSQERIMNLGFVDNVDFDVLQNPDNPDKVDLSFNVLEGKPGMLTAGAGYSSLDGLVGTISMSHMNLFGRGQRASVQWQFGSRVEDYSVSWTTPWVDDSPTSLGVDVYNTRRLSPFQTSLSAFNDHRAGGRVRVGPRFEDDKYQLSLSYTLEKVSIENVTDSFLNTLTPGTSVTSEIGVEFARDTRDSYWDPTRGSRNALGLSLAGGPLQGDNNFYSPSLSDAVHFRLFNWEDTPFTLSFFNRLAFVDSFGPTPTVPVFQRFFIGGQDTLRGYSPNGEAGAQTGGTVYDVFNAEFKFPLAKEHRRTIVAWVFFFDMGGSWNGFQNVNLNIGPDEGNLKTDAGFGIRFTTPAFPIRLDWGYGFNHRPGESKFQVNFGMGNLF